MEFGFRHSGGMDDLLDSASLNGQIGIIARHSGVVPEPPVVGLLLIGLFVGNLIRKNHRKIFLGCATRRKINAATSGATSTYINNR